MFLEEEAGAVPLRESNGAAGPGLRVLSPTPHSRPLLSLPRGVGIPSFHRHGGSTWLYLGAITSLHLALPVPLGKDWFKCGGF